MTLPDIAQPQAHARRPRAPMAPALALALALHLLVLAVLDAWWRRGGEAVPRPAAITVVLAPRAAPRAAEPVAPEIRRAPTATEPAVAAAPAPRPPAVPAAADPRPPVAPSPAPPVAARSAPEQPRKPAAAPVQSAAPPPSQVPATAAATPPTERIVLFAPDGRLRVPTAVLQGEPPPVPSWIAAPHVLAPWDDRVDPLVYEPTALEPIWKPDGESLLDEFMRRSTRTRTFRTPWGSKVTCSWVLIVGGCAW